MRLCKDRTTDHLFAVKILSKEMLKKKKGGNTTETYFEDIKREIAIMKKLQHPNVLKLFEVLDDPKVRITLSSCRFPLNVCVGEQNVFGVGIHEAGRSAEFHQTQRRAGVQGKTKKLKNLYSFIRRGIVGDF